MINGQMMKDVKQYLFSLVYKAQSDISVPILQLISTVIKKAGISQYVKDNFQFN
jgi:hypothetical protein